MNRKQAKEVIARARLGFLTQRDIDVTLSECLVYETPEEIREDIESGELPPLSNEAIVHLASIKSEHDVNLKLLEPLLLDFLIFDMTYATNEYLRAKIAELGYECPVTGEIEEASICPCCEFYSLPPGDEALWEVCTVCFWENGGDGPNHMTLSEAQKNFVVYGAIKKGMRSYIDPDGPLKYAKKA